MTNEYLGWIKKYLSDKFGVELEDIHESSYFEDDLNVGEMDLVELLADLEEELKIDLTEERDNVETVQDLLDLIEEQAN